MERERELATAINRMKAFRILKFKDDSWWKRSLRASLKTALGYVQSGLPAIPLPGTHINITIWYPGAFDEVWRQCTVH